MRKIKLNQIINVLSTTFNTGLNTIYLMLLVTLKLLYPLFKKTHLRIINDHYQDFINEHSYTVLIRIFIGMLFHLEQLQEKSFSQNINQK